MDTPQDATDIANDLHALLDTAEVPGPYVFAGHSFGGLYVLTYADLYPDDVAGLVVIDTTAPNDEPITVTPSDPDAYDPMARVSTLLSTLSELGVPRLEARAEGDGLPPESAEEVRASDRTGNNARAFFDEFLQANDSMKEAAQLTDFGDKPLYVLTAGVGSDADLIAAHERIAKLSTNSTHEVVDGAAHADLIADEEDSKATTEAILAVVQAIRTGSPLNK